MKPQLYNKEPERPPIGVKTTAMRVIIMMAVRSHDKPHSIQVMMLASRKIHRQGIIPRRSRDGVMKAGGGDRNASVMGRGYVGTEVSRGGVGDYGKCRWQREVAKWNEDEQQDKELEEGRRHEGRNSVNATGGSVQRSKVLDARARIKVGRRRQKERPHILGKIRRKATMRRMRKEVTEATRGGNGTGKEGIMVDS